MDPAPLQRPQDRPGDLTGHVIATQEEERRRIARDLHDGTGQELTGLSLSLQEALADFPPGHERARYFVDSAYQASQKALGQIRAISYVLHPPELAGKGLVVALRWYLDGLNRRTHLQINFDAPELTGLTPEAESALFRIVQEGMSNILRHSGSTATSVTLEQSGSKVLLRIVDNGHGMDAADLLKLEGRANLGVGIAGMRERVRQLGGTFAINPGPTGTTVLVSLPAQEKQHVAYRAG